MDPQKTPIVSNFSEFKDVVNYFSNRGKTLVVMTVESFMYSKSQIALGTDVAEEKDLVYTLLRWDLRSTIIKNYIRDFQNRGIPVLIFHRFLVSDKSDTHSNIKFLKRFYEYLKDSNQINPRRNFQSLPNLMHLLSNVYAGNKATYYKGILSTNGQFNGIREEIVLVEFIKRLNVKPDQVIMLNSSWKSLQRIAYYFKTTLPRIKFIGLKSKILPQ